MPASALLAAASIASLKLCADEYLLLLAHPHEVASVTFLARDPLESPLWRLARKHRPNDGSIEDVIAAKPSVVLTMGGGGRATALLARRLGIEAIDLHFVSTLDDVAANFRTVASALGDPSRAEPWVRRLNALRRSSPPGAKDAIWISGSGISIDPDSVGGRWMRLAGLRQRPLTGGRASLETLLVDPPEVLLRSDYRSGQASRGVRWFDHPVVRRVKSKRVTTDGRAWTCMGPLLIAETERLRRAVR